MEVLSKSMIERWIIPHLSKGKRGLKPQVCVCEIVRAILYRLKSGCQWRLLPVKAFFEPGAITWSGVYYYYNKWVKDGSFRNVWVMILRQNKSHIDLSSMQLDGSHTPAKNGGEHIGYQGRKAGRTTNALFFADNDGQPIAVATPQSGNHNDLYEIGPLFSELCGLLEAATITVDGVFLNADPGFDDKELRMICSEKGIEANIKNNRRNTQQAAAYRYFDEALYKRRFVIERANAWIDSFKTLLVRFEVNMQSWVAQHLMAFSVLLLRKINTC